MACRVVVVDCLVILTMKVDFSISKIVLKYSRLVHFTVHNVAKETCPYRTGLMSDFDGVQEQATDHIHHTYLHVVILVRLGNKSICFIGKKSSMLISLTLK